jgi:hypothetical protein
MVPFSKERKVSHKTLVIFWIKEAHEIRKIKIKNMLSTLTFDPKKR